MKTIEKIQYITRDTALMSHSEQAQIMFSQGVKWVQLRMKNAKEEEFYEEATKCMYYAKKFNSKLIINDNVKIAYDVNADGVHLGIKDTPLAFARYILGNNKIIGATANTINDIEEHYKNGADYVGLGPYRYTDTKKNLSPVLGIEKYLEILDALFNKKINIPIIAVGGITIDDIDLLINSGLHGVAISKNMFDNIDKINDYI